MHDGYGASAYEAIVADDGTVVALVVAHSPEAFNEAPPTDHHARLFAAAPELLDAASMGHDDSPGLPCGDLLAAANVLRNNGLEELAERLERKHEAERAAILKATGAQS